MRTTRWAISVMVPTLLLGAATTGAATAEPTSTPASTPASDPASTPASDPAGPGSHDTLFAQGHGGYDVLSYDVRLRYAPASRRLGADTTLRALPTRPLSSFTLDLEGLDVRAIDVDGRAATWRRQGTRLVVTPAQRLTAEFTAVVHYGGTPHTHVDPDGSHEGWVPTHDGAVALGEPVGTMDWVPSDDTPGDKATWTVRVTVPTGLQVVSNGDPEPVRRHGRTTTWVWHERDPMCAYLATVAIGHFQEFRSHVTSADGRTIPVLSFADRGTPDSSSARTQLPAVFAFEERLFGAYPFTSTGMIVDAADVGYALETQTRPFYPGRVGALVHEMAHQWFGDSVGVVDWHDLWLAEGFATYAEWLWDAAHGGPSTRERFERLDVRPASDPLWRPAPTTFTDPADLFGEPVYDRGAMTLEVLRERIGDADFFALLRAWTAQHRHGNVRTEDFEQLAETLSGQDLTALFHAWLAHPGKPTSTATPARGTRSARE